jgi:hypothetical protein
MNFIYNLYEQCRMKKIYIVSHTETYNGYSLNGIKHGYGTVFYTDGSSYSGYFKYGKYSGDGVLKKENGDLMVGEWDNGFILVGEYVFSNGDVYHGSFVDNKINGYGVRTYVNGWVFTGSFVDGEPNGVKPLDEIIKLHREINELKREKIILILKNQK